MNTVRILCALALPVMISACTKPEPPRLIHGQLIYNKLGDPVGCEQGTFIAGASPVDQCLPPDDQCSPQTSSIDPNCLPPGRGQRDPNDGGSRDPSGQTAGRV